MRAMIFLIAMTVPASAGVEVFDCERSAASDYSMFDSVTCSVRNELPRSIASFRFWWQAVQDERQVPWDRRGDDASEPPLTINVQGGIEPEETVPVRFFFRPLNERADPDLVRYEIEVITAFDVNGDPIE